MISPRAMKAALKQQSIHFFVDPQWVIPSIIAPFIFTTVTLGFRYIFVRVPWQRTYLAVFAAFLGTVGESFARAKQNGENEQRGGNEPASSQP